MPNNKGDPEVPPALLDWLRGFHEDETLTIERYERLSGGAIQQNIALDLTLQNGTQESALVLRTDAASGVAVSLSRADEYALLDAAFRAGVTVPEPLGLCIDTTIVGAPFFLMRRVDGTANPVVLTRDTSRDAPACAALVRALGSELARIHAIPWPGSEVTTTSLLEDRVARYRRLLDELTQPRPVLEWALEWLSRQSVATPMTVLCHNDFRTGNLMVNDHAVTGVLDWEFAGLGDPHEDIGWFCAPCWRFARRDRAAGGLGERTDLAAGYEAESGRRIDWSAVAVWEVVATVRWAIIALQQGERFTSGAEQTLELGLTGRMVAELEHDVLDQIRELAQPVPEVDVDAADSGGNSMGRLTIDAPNGEALLGAARELLLAELLPALPDSHRYRALMIANALGIARRECQSSDDDSLGAHAGESPVTTAVLRQGFAHVSTAKLQAEASTGVLRDDVERRLMLANPKRLRHGS